MEVAGLVGPDMFSGLDVVSNSWVHTSEVSRQRPLVIILDAVDLLRILKSVVVRIEEGVKVNQSETFC